MLLLLLSLLICYRLLSMNAATMSVLWNSMPYNVIYQLLNLLTRNDPTGVAYLVFFICCCDSLRGFGELRRLKKATRLSKLRRRNWIRWFVLRRKNIMRNTEADRSVSWDIAGFVFVFAILFWHFVVQIPIWLRFWGLSFHCIQCTYMHYAFLLPAVRTP